MASPVNHHGGGNFSSPTVYFLSGMLAVLMGYSVYTHLTFLNNRNASTHRQKRNKSFDPDNCIQDAIPLQTLAYLTQSNDVQIQGSAVDVILERAMSEAYLPSIIEACSKSQPADTRAMGIAALQLLTRREGNRAALLAADALCVLVDALKSTDPDIEEMTQRYAAMAICDLVQGHDANKRHIIDLEVLDPIIRILTSEHTRNNELKYWTLMILYQLSLSEPFPKVLIEKGCVGLIATMARMTFGNTNMPKFCLQSLVRSIANVGETDAKKMLVELLDYDVVDLISISLRGDDVELIYWAVGLMHEFVIKDVAADKFREIKGVHIILAGLLSAEEMYISRVVLRTVKFMAYGHEKFRQDMVRSGMIKKIMRCLTLEDSDVKHWAALCIHAVAAQVESHKDILGSPDFDSLLEYAEPTKPISAAFISDILSLICCISSNSEHIQNHIDRILAALDTMLSSEEAEVQYNAAGAIFNLVVMKDNFAAKTRESCLGTVIRISVSEGNERVQITCAKICLVLAIKYQSLVTRITLEMIEPLIKVCVRIAQFTLPVIMIQSLIKAAEKDLHALQLSSATSSTNRRLLGPIVYDTGAFLPDYINVSSSGSISNALRLDHVVNTRHSNQYRSRARRRRTFPESQDMTSGNSSPSSSEESDKSDCVRNSRDRLPIPFIEEFSSSDGSSLTGRMVEFVNFEIPPPSAKQLIGALSELRILLEDDQTVGNVVNGTVFDRLMNDMDQMQDALETTDLSVFEQRKRRSMRLSDIGRRQSETVQKSTLATLVPENIRQFLDCLLYFTMYPIIGAWAAGYTKDLDLDNINEKTAHNAYSDMLQWVYSTTRLRGAMDVNRPQSLPLSSEPIESQQEKNALYTSLVKEYTGFSGRSLLVLRSLTRYASVRQHLVRELHFVEVMVYMLQHCPSAADHVLSCLGAFVSSDPALAIPEPSLQVLSTVVWKNMLQCKTRQEPLWFYSRLILAFASRTIRREPEQVRCNSSMHVEIDAEARTRYCIVNNELLREVRNESWTFETVRGTHATPKRDISSSNKNQNRRAYAFEVTLASEGLMQVGWVTDQCEIDPEGGTGVGDDDWSYAYDGCRTKIWHGKHITGQTCYGLEWRSNDVITCCLDIDKGEMRFYKNGFDMGVAFSDVDCSQLWYPAISLSTGQGCKFCFGGPLDPLEYLPAGYIPMARLVVPPVNVELPPPQAFESVSRPDTDEQVAITLEEEEEDEEDIELLENAMRRMSVASPPLLIEEGNIEPSLRPMDGHLGGNRSLMGVAMASLDENDDVNENDGLNLHLPGYTPFILPFDNAPLNDLEAPSLYFESAVAFDGNEDDLLELKSSISVIELGLYCLSSAHVRFEYHATQRRGLIRQGTSAQSDWFPIAIADGDWIGLLFTEQPNRIGVTQNGTHLVTVLLDSNVLCQPVLPFKHGAIKTHTNFGDEQFRWPTGNTPRCKEKMVEYLDSLL